MPQDFSKQNQSCAETTYRFGDFRVDPGNRQITQAGIPLPLQPKAFDALLCLLRRAGRLVSKEELVQTLWPSVHVSEMNLTNIIVSLRKAIGREAIHTVSKYGYRFALEVEDEPGVAHATYDRFLRARNMTAQRSLEFMAVARDLYWLCLTEDPNFASAWAWLGRSCWFLGKFSKDGSTNFELAEAAFRRAFLLDPDLAAAHQFYTFLQTDTGSAEEAMKRLLHRLRSHPGEPESFVGLVQSFRFRGLLEESIAAHHRAAAFDPAVASSVAHTLFLAGDYAAAIASYSGRAAYYLDAAAWAALGKQDRASTLLKDRLESSSLSPLMTALLRSLLALLDGNSDQAVEHMGSADTTREPEISIYFARHYGRLGLADKAVGALQRAAHSGFVCAPKTLVADPWLEAVRTHHQFPSLLETAEKVVSESRQELAGEFGQWVETLRLPER